MHQSKLVKALATLDAWELRHFHDFIHSPFHNKHERLTSLVDYILALAPEFPPEALERRHVYAHVMGSEGWDEQKFKDLLSLGMKTLRNFLAYYRLRQNGFTTGMAMLEEMRERGWEGEYNKAREALEESLEEMEEKLQERYLKGLHLQESWITHLNNTANRRVDSTIQLAADQLDAYYMLSKLKYGVEMVNRQNVVAQEFGTGLLPAVLAHLERDESMLDNFPAIRMYLLIYRCLTLPDQEMSFEQLRALMREGMETYPSAEKREIYGYAINFGIRQLNQGKKHYVNTVLELYQDALADGALIAGGWLSQWDYKNIVSAGLRAGSYTWSEQFIESYKGKLEPGCRENAYTYNLASLFFEQGDYRKALRLLQHVEFSDVFYHLGAKVMLLKSFFELNDHEALMSLCDAFKIYLKRNKTLSKAHYTVYFNLVTFTRRLAELRRKTELISNAELKAKLDQLRTAISEADGVAQLPWLLGKVDWVGQGR